MRSPGRRPPGAPATEPMTRQPAGTSSGGRWRAASAPLPRPGRSPSAAVLADGAGHLGDVGRQRLEVELEDDTARPGDAAPVAHEAVGDVEHGDRSCLRRLEGPAARGGVRPPLAWQRRAYAAGLGARLQQAAVPLRRGRGSRTPPSGHPAGRRSAAPARPSRTPSAVTDTMTTPGGADDRSPPSTATPASIAGLGPAPARGRGPSRRRASGRRRA